MEVGGSQIWGTGWMFQQFIMQIPRFSHCQNTCVGRCTVVMNDFFFRKPGLFARTFSSSLVKRLE
jgi:hypothetical protein